MAGPRSTSPDDESNEGDDHTAAFQTFETSPEPDAGAGGAGDGGSEDGERPKGLLTVLAVVVALGLGLTIGILADTATPVDLTTSEILTTAGLTAIVALSGLIAVRWGWWVTAGVTLAFFALTIYNLALNQDSTVFSGSDPQDLGYAVLGPGPGVILGYVLQGVYSLVAGE